MLLAASAAAALAAGLAGASAEPPAAAVESTWLPTGASITPSAPPGTRLLPLNPGLSERPAFLADHAVATALSPDGRTLLVLTSGYNRNFDAAGKLIPESSSDYVFVFDASGDVPRQRQALPVPNAFVGLAFAPDGAHFFVAGGVDDAVHVFGRGADGWQEQAPAIALGHAHGEGLAPERAVSPPAAAGLAVSHDGARLVVANFGNDSVSVVDWAMRRVVAELDLRPGKRAARAVGTRGGTYPYAVVAGAAGAAYVSSLRDREVIVIGLDPAPAIRSRIKVTGNPNALLLDRSGKFLYVSEDNVDRVGVIAVARAQLRREIALRSGRAGIPDRGLSPDALALSPDGRTLYAALAGANAIAVLSLPSGARRGLIPTAWYPAAVTVRGDGLSLYVATAKSPGVANPGNCLGLEEPPLASGCAPGRPLHAANAYVLQQSPGGLAMIPVPDAASLARLTRVVDANNRIFATPSAAEERLFASLRQRIRHVIYIIKENRTYDQILGDLAVGNGDPALAQFPASVTPNQHRLASAFVDLDNFFDSGEVSGTGWPWSVAARTTDVIEKTVPPQYAERGFNYESEGTNREVNVALAGAAARRKANPDSPDDEDILAGVSDVAAPDGPDDGEPEQGRIWHEALRRHLSVRNYGFFIDLARYEAKAAGAAVLPLLRDPAQSRTVVAYPTDPALAAHTDPYFRGFDNRFPDFYRVQEWAREFADFEQRGTLPRLELVRLMHDHLGDFATAIDGVDTPLTQIADNDYAVGLLVERVARSRYARDTLIFIVEDDAQAGPDHVDAHRSPAFIVGPYVRHGAVVSTRYTTVDLLRTMELVLGLQPLNFHDAVARPMADVFDLSQASWRFTAAVPAALRRSKLSLPPQPAGQASPAACGPRDHDAGYWAAHTAGMDFSSEDRMDSARLNRVVWSGLERERPYPVERSGLDLRTDRASWLRTAAEACADRH